MTDLPTSRSRPSRRLRWALGLSLALNLIVIGFIAGAALRFREAGPVAGPDPRSYATPYVRALPPEVRRSIRRAMRRDVRSQQGGAEARAQYQQVLATLRSDTFDPAAVAAALTLQADRALLITTKAQEAWLAHVQDMTASERAAYADRLEEVIKRGPRPRKARE